MGKNSPIDSGDGCFVATATMGNYEHPTVINLRRFRDEYLAHHKMGRFFIKYYYKYSPSIAGKIEKSYLLKKISYFLIVKPAEILSFIIG